MEESNVNAVLSTVQVVQCVDNSGSMRSYDYIKNAISSSQSFINLMMFGDSVGAVEFGYTATVLYGDKTQSPPKVEKIEFGNGVQDAVTEAIGTLRANGGCTNVSDGIIKSNQMFRNGAGNPAIVLLSDGYANEGITDPSRYLNNTDFAPIHTIALGPKSDVRNLTTIAELTNGKYHYCPTDFDLATIYFDISAETEVVSAVLSNDQVPTPSKIIKKVGAMVPQSCNMLSFAINWTPGKATLVDKAVNLGDLEVTILCNNEKLNIKPFATENGSSVYHISSPKPGLYTAELKFIGRNDTLNINAAFMDYDLPQKMRITTTRQVKLGHPINIVADIFDKAQNGITKGRLTGTIVAPTIDFDTAYAANKAEIDGIDNDQEESLNRRFLAAQNKRGHDNPFIPRTTLAFTPSHDDGVFFHSFTPTVPGIYLVHLKAENDPEDPKDKFTMAKVLTYKVE